MRALGLDGHLESVEAAGGLLLGLKEPKLEPADPNRL
jgi:hypothetical protein